jgi:uncharacterized protein (DUF1697 family)
MPTYIAMLRGVNVGGHKAPMAQLKAMCEALGLAEVRTYIQSGNVIFKAAKGSLAALCGKFEARFLKEFGFSSPVILRTPDEMAQAIRNNPFLKQKGIDPGRLHITFLAQSPIKDALMKVEALKSPPDQLRILGREIYLYCPAGYGNTKLHNNALEKAAGVPATTRNWNTVNKLYEMAMEG